MAKVSRNSRVTSLKKIRLTPEVVDQLESFFESIPPNEFRETLLEIYLSYVRHEHHSLPYNFKELAESMGMFFDFLKYTDEYQAKTDSSQKV